MKVLMMMLLLLLLLGLVSQHASGVEVVYDGVESALLPYLVPVDVSRSSTAAVWDRKDLSIPTVHVRLQSGDQFEEQNHRYSNRTSMRADALQTGDLSLTLRNPTGSDSGTYTCTVRRFGRDQSRTDVELKVTEPPPSVCLTVLPAVLLPVVLLAAGFGVFIYRMLKIRKVLEVQMLEVTQGVKSVLLPFKANSDLPLDATLEWRHQNKMVHMYQSGQSKPDLQDPDYKGRTRINRDPLKAKDLSLTLENVQLTDSGVYTCTIYNKDGLMLLQKSVTLSVRDYQAGVVEVTQGQKSVLMPFKITDELPPEVKVQWRRTHPKDKMVLLYDSSQKQPLSQDQVYGGRIEMSDNALKNKDFSLTLKDLQLTDSGVYTCTVCNKDGLMLLQKSVTLSVRGEKQDSRHEH